MKKSTTKHFGPFSVTKTTGDVTYGRTPAEWFFNKIGLTMWQGNLLMAVILVLLMAVAKDAKAADISDFNVSASTILAERFALRSDADYPKKVEAFVAFTKVNKGLGADVVIDLWRKSPVTDIATSVMVRAKAHLSNSAMDAATLLDSNISPDMALCVIDTYIIDSSMYMMLSIVYGLDEDNHLKRCRSLVDAARERYVVRRLK